MIVLLHNNLIMKTFWSDVCSCLFINIYTLPILQRASAIRLIQNIIPNHFQTFQSLFSRLSSVQLNSNILTRHCILSIKSNVLWKQPTKPLLAIPNSVASYTYTCEMWYQKQKCCFFPSFHYFCCDDLSIHRRY